MLYNKRPSFILLLATSTVVLLLIREIALYQASRSDEGSVLQAANAWGRVWSAANKGSGEGVKDEYMAIVMMVRDQALDMPEFLQHHHYNMGINRFYIFDDGSEPPLSTQVKSFGVPEDIITIEYNKWRANNNKQVQYYNRAAAQWGMNHTWMGFFDPDEFIDTPGPESLREILKGLEPLQHIGALGMNWQLHTSNGQLVRAESTRKTYTQCISDDFRGHPGVSDNREFKSFVRTSLYYKALNAHHYITKNRTVTVGEHGDVISHRLFRDPITRTRIGVHHYIMKSKQEYEEKMVRGGGGAAHRDWDNWREMEEVATHVDCPEVARWV